MMIKRIAAIVTATLSILSVSAALAHHSSAPHFDANTPIQIEGVVTAFKFVNPHAWLYIDVANSDGTVENWNCELGAATGLRRNGWTKDLFSPGTKLKLEGIAARRDPLGCSFTSADLADGTHIARNGSLTKGGSATVVAVATTNSTASNADMPFAGTWKTTPRNRRGGGGGGGPNGNPNRFANILTDKGKAALANYDMRFDDPALQCSPSSIIRGWGEPGGISEVHQTPEQIVINHEYMDTVRVVDMSTREHPTHVERSLTGHSVGWFEDETLVIETVGFNAGVLVPHPGLLHTEDMRIVERLSLSDDNTQLIRDYEVSDPAYLKEPHTGRSSWTRTDIAISKYECVELGGISNIRTQSAQ
jgi:hypothetical protein